MLREKLLASGSAVAKSYLNILANEIVVQDKTAIIVLTQIGAPGGSRTHYLQLRKLSLYPNELRALRRNY